MKENKAKAGKLATYATIMLLMVIIIIIIAAMADNREQQFQNQIDQTTQTNMTIQNEIVTLKDENYNLRQENEKLRAELDKKTAAESYGKKIAEALALCSSGNAEGAKAKLSEVDRSALGEGLAVIYDNAEKIINAEPSSEEKRESRR